MTKIAKLSKHAEQAATLMKMLGHPSRLMILCLLAEQELCVGDLLENSDLSQSAFSQHLAALRKYKVVKTRKKSQTVYYSIADIKAKKVVQLLHSLYCK